MESKCGALSPPSSMSLTSAERLTLSFPFQMKSKIILLASFTKSLFRHHACAIQKDWNHKRFHNLNPTDNGEVSPPPYF